MICYITADADIMVRIKLCRGYSGVNPLQMSDEIKATIQLDTPPNPIHIP
jgi:hypothetical protein